MIIQAAKCQGKNPNGTWGRECGEIFIRVDDIGNCPNGCADDWTEIAHLEIEKGTAHQAAVYAQWRYGHKYEGESAEKIFNSLDPHQKQVCWMAVGGILAAADETETTN